MRRYDLGDLDEVRRVDISRVDGITRDPERIRRLFQSLARNTATRAPITTLAADAAGPGSTMTDNTARGYLAALARLMIVEVQPSWTPHLRSRADLRIYAQAFDGRVKQYRDNKGVEVDAIVETDDGRWAAFEVKLAPGRIEEGAAGLRSFVAKADTTKTGEPSALGVITGSGYGYVRADGIHVIPIGALKP